MKLVDKVKIAFNDYKVNIINGHVIDKDIVCYGNIEYAKGNINISNLHSEDWQKCTLIHECLHGINEEVEAELTEDQIRTMAKGLYCFIKDNPYMFKED